MRQNIQYSSKSMLRCQKNSSVNSSERPIKVGKREMGDITARHLPSRRCSTTSFPKSAFRGLWQELSVSDLQLLWHSSATFCSKREIVCQQESERNIIFRSRFWLNYYNECGIDPAEFNLVKIKLFSITWFHTTQVERTKVTLSCPWAPLIFSVP